MPTHISELDISNLKLAAQRAQWLGDKEVEVSADTLLELLERFEDFEADVEEAARDAQEESFIEYKDEIESLAEELALVRLDLAQAEDRIAELETHLDATVPVRA